MEAVELEQLPLPYPVDEGNYGGDLGATLLARFQCSQREDQQHICSVVGAMSQGIKDQGFPLSPVAYFGATVSSLDRISQDPSCGADPAIAALLVFLSEVLPCVPPVVLRNRAGPVLDTLRRILTSGMEREKTLEEALRCVPLLLVTAGRDSWSIVAPVYKILLEFINDERPEVRKLAHSCIRDVLQGFQGSPTLALASKEIKVVFERFLLLAGSSSSVGTNETAGIAVGAWNIIYTLNALHCCLPYMSVRYTNEVLSYFKPLLELQHPIVTRNIMDALYALCLSPTSAVAPERVMELLCLVASSASDKESADAMASTARLLSVGTKKIYELNRQACVVKLPFIFDCLGGMLARGHGEAAFAATEALKSLIYSCIDDMLIKQGVDQINLPTLDKERRSGPTTIEKICVLIEDLLSYQYSEVWEMSFQILSAMFENLGQSSACIMAGSIRNLADMHKLSDEMLVHRRQLHACLGTAVSAMGPKLFLDILPLNLEMEDLSEANIWLLPILKQHVVGAELHYFGSSILKTIKWLQQKSVRLEREGLIVSARNAEALVYSLWSLLPAFCNYPVDITTGFVSLQKVLFDTIREYPDLRGIICSSLQVLIRQNRNVLNEQVNVPDDEMSNFERKARAHYTCEVAKSNLQVIGSFSTDFFRAAYDILLKDLKDIGGCLQCTVREFASISDKIVVKEFFAAIMHKLLVVIKGINVAVQNRSSNCMQIDDSTSENSLLNKRVLLLDLAISLLPGLGADEVDCLFSAIKPGFEDEEGLIQKKTYKILSLILKERDDFLQSRLDDLLGIMIEILPACHFSAKRYRLDCLYFLIIHVSKGASEERTHDIVGSYLTEIILALKEANKKTRNRAYDILVEIGHVFVSEEHGAKRGYLHQFFNMVAGGLAGETPCMISAAIKGLARLAYEFSDLLNTAYSLLPSTFLLMQRENREITKANLGFLKVLVAKTQGDGLHVHLKNIMEGLLKWQDGTKNHFKAKVKLLVEMLVKKCGLDAVKAVMPEEHMKLLTNIRKISERKKRKGKSEDGSLYSKSSNSRLSRWNHTRIFSSFGDEDENVDSDAGYMDTRTAYRKQIKASLKNSRAASSRLKQQLSSKRLSEDLLDQLDLLDRQKTRLSLQRSSGNRKRKAGSDEELEIAADGRIVIPEEGVRQKRKKHSSSDSDVRGEASGRKLGKGKQFSISDAGSKAGSWSMASSLSKTQRKRQQMKSDSGWAYAGGEYTSKKASGDVKVKDKLEPYAYWPLDRKLLNRRSELKAVARKGMAKVMKKKHEGKGAGVSIKGMMLSRAQRRAKRKGKLSRKHVKD